MQFFMLYAMLLNDEITQEEFDAEIEKHQDKYVILIGKRRSQNEIKIALRLKERMKGIDSMDDFQSMFSINNESIKIPKK